MEGGTERKLAPAEDGLYVLKDEYRLSEAGVPDSRRPRFVVTGEISSIYKKMDRVRKVHSMFLLPGLEDADRLARRLELIGNIHSDGRPILGLDCRDLLEIMLETCPDAVTLMTFHGSKGLEFPAVFLYGVRKGLVPLERTGNPVDLQEERRLFYVGMTRAKEELILTVSSEESPFVGEIPEQVVRREEAKKEKPAEEAVQMSLFDFMG